MQSTDTGDLNSSWSSGIYPQPIKVTKVLNLMLLCITKSYFPLLKSLYDGGK